MMKSIMYYVLCIISKACDLMILGKRLQKTRLSASSLTGCNTDIHYPNLSTGTISKETLNVKFLNVLALSETNVDLTGIEPANPNYLGSGVYQYQAHTTGILAQTIGKINGSHIKYGMTQKGFLKLTKKTLASPSEAWEPNYEHPVSSRLASLSRRSWLKRRDLFTQEGFIKLTKRALGYKISIKPVKYIRVAEIEGKKIYRRKCDFDMEICIDVHSLLQKDFQSFIFFTGDGDFEPLYKLLIEQKKQVIVVYASGHLGREIWEMKQGIFKTEIDRFSVF